MVYIIVFIGIFSLLNFLYTLKLQNVIYENKRELVSNGIIHDSHEKEITKINGQLSYEFQVFDNHIVTSNKRLNKIEDANRKKDQPTNTRPIKKG